MNKKILCLLIALIIIFFKCGPKREQIEVIAPKANEKAIKKAAPPKKYCFYVPKEFHPKNFIDIVNSQLFACGVDEDVVLNVAKVLVEGLDMPLFTDVHRYVINPIVLAGSLKMSEQIKIPVRDGKYELYINVDISVYSKDTLFVRVLNDCFEDMKKLNRSVLLMPRNVDSDVLNQMIEIVFKKGDVKYEWKVEQKPKP